MHTILTRLKDPDSQKSKSIKIIKEPWFLLRKQDFHVYVLYKSVINHPSGYYLRLVEYCTALQYGTSQSSYARFAFENMFLQ